MLSLHEMRRQLVKFRTAQINALHGLQLEFGETVRKGSITGQGYARGARHLKEKLPPFLIYQIEDKNRRLMHIPGVGSLVAPAADPVQDSVQMPFLSSDCPGAYRTRWLGN